MATGSTIAKELKMHAKGFVLNRSARKQKMELLVDPSEETFLSRATAEKDRIRVVLTPPNMPPIELTGIPLGLRLRLRDVQLTDPSQIGLVEWLINDEEPSGPCTIYAGYCPEQDDLPFEPDQPQAEGPSRTYTVDPDGFVTDPIEIPVIVPDFLKAECTLLFACIDDRWYSGFEIKGRVERTRRINTIRDLLHGSLADCIAELGVNIHESLEGDKSRLAEFIGYKIIGAVRAIDDQDATLAEAMAEPVHLPADFAEGATTEGTETTEKETMEKDGSDSPSASSAVTPPEILTFKAKGLKQAEVTITLQRRSSDWRYGYDWRLGNYADGEPIAASDWYDGKFLCLQNLRTTVETSIKGIQITGTADHRRSTESRRETLLDQFNEWIVELIEAAEVAEAETGHENETAEDAEDAEETDE